MSNSSIFKINKWLGLNENPDGDTQLKPGEAAEMKNFKITPDGNLQVRPGFKTIHQSKNWKGPIQGIWHGYVQGNSHTIFAAEHNLWEFNLISKEATPILAQGETITGDYANFIGFSGKLYIFTGSDLLEWDGSVPPQGGAKKVVGYRPITHISLNPNGIGATLEQVNKLTAARRVRFSPDGEATILWLPEKQLKSIDYVRSLVTGQDLQFVASGLQNGFVRFNEPPEKGTNTIEVGYTCNNNFRHQAENMKFAEIFNGGTDNRVFIYGDGSNKILYSGIDFDGAPRLDYFPDLNVVEVGSANTPITALIRHYDSLAVFKSDSSFTLKYGAINLADGSITAAFYLLPANRSIGHIPTGQAQLVNNSPRTLFGSAIYDWQNYSNLTSDERQAKHISSKVFETLSKINLEEAYTFDDNQKQEYYIIQNGTAIINSYASNTWFIYKDFNIEKLCIIHGELYGTTNSGDIVHISRKYRSDNGKNIDTFWRSGSIAFARSWQRKNAIRIFVTMKPETRSFIETTIRTNVKSIYPKIAVRQGLASLSSANFKHWGFKVNRQPQTKRLKIRAKKFAYYQLLFQSNSDWSTATILGADIKLQYTGDVK